MKVRVLRPVWLACAVLSLFGSRLWAVDASSFEHTPPSWGEAIMLDSKPGAAGSALHLPVAVSANGIRRARLLLLTADGYQVVPLAHKGDSLGAFLPVDSESAYRYSFQVETLEGLRFESGDYVVKRPLDPAAGERAKRLLSQAESLEAVAAQLERQLAYLRIEKPGAIKERSLQERKYARSALASQLLEYSRLRGEVESRLNSLKKRLSADAEGSAQLKSKIEELIAVEIDPLLAEVK